MKLEMDYKNEPRNNILGCIANFLRNSKVYATLEFSPSYAIPNKYLISSHTKKSKRLI